MVAPLWVNHDYLTTIDMPSASWQHSVSSQHMVKSLTVNLMSLFNLKLCTHIWSTNINLDTLYIRLFGPLGLILHTMGELERGRIGGVDWASGIFSHGWTKT